MKKIVWFIRHGESLANADKHYKLDNFSNAQVPLSDIGKKQAEALTDYFVLAPDLIIVSPYSRAKQTAGFLIEKFPDVPKLEWPIHEFTFFSTDRRFDTTVAGWKLLVDAYWQRGDPLHLDGKGAESFVDFINRVSDVIEKIKNRKEKFIVLFSHELTICAVKYLLENKPKEVTSKEMKEFREYFLLNRILNAEKVEFVFDSL
jgi:broad specificity phosphatase PhoE